MGWLSGSLRLWLSRARRGGWQKRQGGVSSPSPKTAARSWTSAWCLKITEPARKSAWAIR